MVKKLLLLLILLLFLSFAPKTFAVITDYACSPTQSCPSQINCDVGCLNVSLTCVNGWCRVPPYGFCAATTAMMNKGCTDGYSCYQNSTFQWQCQPPKPLYSACTNSLECGFNSCTVNQCQTGTSNLAASCCPLNSFYCPATGRCSAQDDGSCPCSLDNPTSTPTPVTSDCPATNKGTGCTCQQNSDCSSGYCSETTSGLKCAAAATPTPIVGSCNSVTTGVAKIDFVREPSFCWNQSDSTARQATITCNDGFKQSYMLGYCISDTDWKGQAKYYCTNHQTCPTPTPSNTPTATPPNTPTPTPPLTCDPNHDGAINQLDFQIWKDEFTTGVGNKSACFAPDTSKVDILDFQVWKDINFGLRSKF